MHSTEFFEGLRTVNVQVWGFFVDLLLTVFLAFPCFSMTSPAFLAFPCFSSLFRGCSRSCVFCFSVLVLLFLAFHCFFVNVYVSYLFCSLCAWFVLPGFSPLDRRCDPLHATPRYPSFCPASFRNGVVSGAKESSTRRPPQYPRSGRSCQKG